MVAGLIEVDVGECPGDVGSVAVECCGVPSRGGGPGGAVPVFAWGGEAPDLYEDSVDSGVVVCCVACDLDGAGCGC